jgi:hypothetical protein
MKERIEIFADRKFAIAFYCSLLCIAVWLLVGFWSEDKSAIATMAIIIGGVSIGLLSAFGLFTIFSSRFVYYGAKTEEYERHRLVGHSKPFFLVQDDRLQYRTNPNKQAYFEDIISISLIPIRDFEDDTTVTAFLEIKTSKTRIVLTNNDVEFLESFNRFCGQSVEIPSLNLELTGSHFGSTKLYWASMLGIYSPLRMELWSTEKKTTTANTNHQNRGSK